MTTFRSPPKLRDDLLAIWHAGLAAVKADALVQANVVVDGDFLLIDEEPIDLRNVRRIVVVGAGKAGTGMAAGLEAALGPQLMQAKQLTGWINVPDDCVPPVGTHHSASDAFPMQRDITRRVMSTDRREFIHLHGARPAGLNEPTAAGVFGATKILELVQSLAPQDLCIALLSGGGSALLPAPAPGITLADKQAITRFLSGAGANIAELNTVRKQLSEIKGGGLLRKCRAGRLVSLIVSDVIGDPLDLIASGPTVFDSSTPAVALAILDKFHARQANVAPTVIAYLEQASRQLRAAQRGLCPVQNLIIGNNAVAVDAAGVEAERRGYSHAMSAARQLEGPAEDVGRHLATMALRMRDERGPDCLITGGEPTVQLVDSAVRGRGGRNQQLVLAGLEQLLTSGASTSRGPIAGIGILSGGTDGEDGPTDAAGAYFNAAIVQQMQRQQLSPADFLRRNDAYNFFAPLDALLKTGPTHTNVCDVRVVVVDRVETLARVRH